MGVAVRRPDVTETATKLSLVPLHKHSPGGSTIDMPHRTAIGGCVSFRRAIPCYCRLHNMLAIARPYIYECYHHFHQLKQPAAAAAAAAFLHLFRHVDDIGQCMRPSLPSRWGPSSPLPQLGENYHTIAGPKRRDAASCYRPYRLRTAGGLQRLRFDGPGEMQQSPSSGWPPHVRRSPWNYCAPSVTSAIITHLSISGNGSPYVRISA